MDVDGNILVFEPMRINVLLASYPIIFHTFQKWHWKKYKTHCTFKFALDCDSHNMTGWKESIFMSAATSFLQWLLYFFYTERSQSVRQRKIDDYIGSYRSSSQTTTSKQTMYRTVARRRLQTLSSTVVAWSNVIHQLSVSEQRLVARALHHNSADFPSDRLCKSNEKTDWRTGGPLFPVQKTASARSAKRLLQRKRSAKRSQTLEQNKWKGLKQRHQWLKGTGIATGKDSKQNGYINKMDDLDDFIYKADSRTTLQKHGQSRWLITARFTMASCWRCCLIEQPVYCISQIQKRSRLWYDSSRSDSLHYSILLDFHNSLATPVKARISFRQIMIL